MAKSFVFRCRKCWHDYEVEVPSIDMAPKTCGRCGKPEMYHHSTQQGASKLNKMKSGSQDVQFAGMREL